ncbi:hypothetical protein H0H81_009746 [Sphagnurus paluster]|uniref:Uncharacterized protein n=1 Tax=Sphagnurus paluster TaxID=117069 RepID=A0A9P7KJW6_9AGAR|nr:hypothetical protein H0H81_009746 [Sphagnurus paluster]
MAPHHNIFQHESARQVPRTIPKLHVHLSLRILVGVIYVIHEHIFDAEDVVPENAPRFHGNDERGALRIHGEALALVERIKQTPCLRRACAFRMAYLQIPEEVRLHKDEHMRDSREVWVFCTLSVVYACGASVYPIVQQALLIADSKLEDESDTAPIPKPAQHPHEHPVLAKAV